MTAPDLGIYARDPRIKIVSNDEIRIGRTVHIETVDDPLHWLLTEQHDAETPRHTFAGTLEQCLAFTLGEPAEVGPIGMRGWMHTDGRVYHHDPATTGMRPAGTLAPGDVVDWPHLDAFTITDAAVNRRDELGEWRMAYPIRFPRRRPSFWFFDHDALVPVRFED
jgi:hypothetical protein